MTIGMVEAWNDTRMVTNMRVSLKIISLMAKGSTHGLTVKSTKENGNKDLKKVRAFGKAFLETLTSESGPRAKRMDTVCISGRMETGTKVSGSSVSSMGKVPIYLQMVMFTRVSIHKVNRMALDNTNGKTQASMSVNSGRDSSMAKASGVKGKTHKIAIITKVSTSMIKSRALEFLHGSQVINTEAATKTTNDMGTVR